MGFRPFIASSSSGNTVPRFAAGPFSDTNFLRSAGGSLAGMDLGANTSLVVVLNPVDPVPPGASWSPISYRNPGALGANGWGLFVTTNGDGPQVGMYYIASSAVLVNFLGSLSRVPGQPIRIVFVDDGTNFKVSVNGSPVISVARATYAAGTSTERAQIGTFLGSANFADTTNQITSFAVLHRALSDIESVAESSLASFDVGVAADSQCTVNGNVTRDYAAGGATWVTQGTSPITLARTGTVPVTKISDAAYKSILLTRPEDTSIWTPTTGAGISYNRSTNEPRWIIDTDAEELIVRQVVTNGSPYFTSVSARILGGATLPRVPNGAFAFPYRMSAAFALGTGGVAKTVEITPGAQEATLSASLFSGGFPYSIHVPQNRTATIRSATVPTRRLYVVGDSIATGQKAASPELQGAFALVRLDYPGQVTIDAAVSRAFFNEMNSGLGQGGLVARIQSGLDGSSTNEIWFQWSTNDFTLGGVGLWSSLVTFTSTYNSFLVALRTAIGSSVKIYVQTMAPRTDVTTNSLGQTIAQMRTATTNACSGVANLTVVDGATLNGALDADGAHKTTAGHATDKAVIKTALGY